MFNCILESFLFLFAKLFALFIRLLVRLTCKQLPHQHRRNEPLLPAYDFIVVGAGASGCVVAGRLAETGASVLLLEAGGSAPLETSVPGMTVLTAINSELQWGLRATPRRQQNSMFENEVQSLIQGRVMGGSNTLNALKYVRGHKQDYDNWASLGNEGWDYESVLPYYKKLENFTGPETEVTAHYSGKGGPFTVSLMQSIWRVKDAFLQAGQELGYSIIEPNGPATIGFAPYCNAVKDGIRVTSAESHVTPNLHRPNFHVRINCLVKKVLIDEEKRAVGVDVFYAGNDQSVTAKKEVILSCGAIQSPKLLMLSGIGPVSHLKEMEIPVVSPVEGVGKNLQDHPVTRSLVFSVRPGTAMNGSDFFNFSTIWQYFRHKAGFLSSVYGLEGQAFVNLSGDSEWPDVVLDIGGITHGNSGGYVVPKLIGMKEESFNGLYGSVLGKESIFIGIGLARPKSRGSVILKTLNPRDNPAVDFNYFDHPDDMELLLKGIKLAHRLAETKAMKTILGTEYQQPRLEVCAQLPPLSEVYWSSFVRHTVEVSTHYAGTCKMAPPADPLGVVSSRLCVRGVQGLRVVDASVMPQVITTDTMAPCLMIAERAMDFVKEDWGLL